MVLPGLLIKILSSFFNQELFGGFFGPHKGPGQNDAICLLHVHEYIFSMGGIADLSPLGRDLQDPKQLF